MSSSISDGFLSSLLGVGCECEGYGVRIVGHSLGGAIAAVLGMKVFIFLMQCFRHVWVLFVQGMHHFLPPSPCPPPFEKKKHHTFASLSVWILRIIEDD